MSGDLFSSQGKIKEFETWYERDRRTWVEFRKGCKGRVFEGENGTCYILDAMIPCSDDSMDKCPLWYVRNFRERQRRKDD